MQKELPYLDIEGAYGGFQLWFRGDRWMKIGGCAAVTACDTSIYLQKYRGVPNLYPYDIEHLTKADYVKFGMTMKRYIGPRWMGVDKLSLFINGFGGYLYDRGVSTVTMVPWEGEHTEADTTAVIRHQVDAGLPLPCLNLRHWHPIMEDIVWHWFMIVGYMERDGLFFVKIATYGTSRWINFHIFWNTGFSRKGGLILLRD